MWKLEKEEEIAMNNNLFAWSMGRKEERETETMIIGGSETCVWRRLLKFHNTQINNYNSDDCKSSTRPLKTTYSVSQKNLRT